MQLKLGRITIGLTVKARVEGSDSYFFLSRVVLNIITVSIYKEFFTVDKFSLWFV